MNVKKFDSINVVPFIDIMLVLLVMVLTTATFVAKGLIPIDLSQSQSADDLKLNKELIITIDKENRIYLDKKRVERALFETELASFPVSTPIFINVHKQIVFENFVYILDILKKHEYTNLGIITQDE